MTKSKNVPKGKLGEELAVKYLSKLGAEILQTNWRYSRIGEIDIIAKEEDTLCFIEVKTRTSTKFGTPAEAVTPKKMQTILKLAEIYLAENLELNYKNLRFDIVEVILEKIPKLTYIKDIYQF